MAALLVQNIYCAASWFIPTELKVSSGDKELLAEDKEHSRINAKALAAMYGLWKALRRAGCMLGVWLLLTGDAESQLTCSIPLADSCSTSPRMHLRDIC